jgi:hypothetical protein
MAVKRTRMASEVARQKNRLAEVCGAFPEVETSGAQHLTLVRKRTFAYYLDNHQGDGRIALVCKATPADQDFLVKLDPITSMSRPISVTGDGSGFAWTRLKWIGAKCLIWPSGPIDW